MAKPVQYVQCILKKGKTTQTSWIPEKYAVVGKYLELHDGDIWKNGWQVKSIGAKVSKEAVDVLEQDYKRTRKASDT